MAPRKAPAKKAASGGKGGSTAKQAKIAIVKVELDVPIDSLQPYADNPRQGDPSSIAESLDENGMYRPITVNIGTKTGRKNEILAGNHTWQGAKLEGWPTIAVAWVDTDEVGAAKIVLTDNRQNDLAGYNSDNLAKVLERVPDPVGTGYSREDVAALLAARDTGDIDTLASIVRPDVELNEDIENPLDRVNILGDDPDDDDDVDPADTAPDGFGPDDHEPPEEEEESFDDSLSQLQGVLALNAEADLDGKNWYGIPELRPDLILDSFPRPIDTWAGKDVTPDDGVTTWLWNYGLASFTGVPVDRAILTFFTWDDKFMNWWEEPAFMTAKLVNSGMRMAIVPDFSFYDNWPRAQHIMSAYRGQWCGRFFQEAGMQVIPRLQFDDMESFKFNMIGIPKGTPTLACSIQNIDRHQGKDENGHSEKMRHYTALMQHGIDELKPKEFLVYGGGTARRMVEEILKPPKGTDVLFVDNYVAKRRGVAFDKKEGLGSKGKQNKATKKMRAAQEVEEDDDE